MTLCKAIVELGSGRCEKRTECAPDYWQVITYLQSNTGDVPYMPCMLHILNVIVTYIYERHMLRSRLMLHSFSGHVELLTLQLQSCPRKW
jgi:hypothetical protein